MEFKIRDKVVTFRKWKVKDRKEFIDVLKSTEDMTKALNVLVYNVIDNDKIVFTPEEFRYALTKIRQASIGESLNFDLNCSKCKKDFKIEINLDLIVKPVFGEYKTISVGEVELELQDIPNKEYYLKAIEQCTDDSNLFLTDLLYHIKSLNGNDAISFDKLSDYFDNLDIDISDKIFEKYKTIKFKIDDIHTVKCPNCEFEEKYLFDELDEFIPKSWFGK